MPRRARRTVRRPRRIVVVRTRRTQPRDSGGRWVSVPEDILWETYITTPDRWPALRGLQRQVPVPVAGRTYHLDFGVTARRLGIEINGLAFHSGQEAWARDHQRRRRIAAAGWTVLEYTAKEAAETPTLVLDELNRLWSRARR